MESTHPEHVLPTTGDPSGVCPNPACGKYAHFSPPEGWEGQGDVIWPHFGGGRRYDLARVVQEREKPLSAEREFEDIRLYLWTCPACEHTCAVIGHGKHVSPGEGKPFTYQETPELLWPSRAPRELDNSVPATIRDLFAEGSTAENAGALRAAAALYRATVEEICTNRSAQGNNLHDKLEDLKNRGVDDDIVAALHEARFLGNWSLHEGLVFAADEVADVADLIVEAAFALYVQPAERARLSEARRTRREGGSARG